MKRGLKLVAMGAALLSVGATFEGDAIASTVDHPTHVPDSRKRVKSTLAGPQPKPIGALSDSMQRASKLDRIFAVSTHAVFDLNNLIFRDDTTPFNEKINKLISLAISVEGLLEQVEAIRRGTDDKEVHRLADSLIDDFDLFLRRVDGEREKLEEWEAVQRSPFADDFNEIKEDHKRIMNQFDDAARKNTNPEKRRDMEKAAEKKLYDLLNDKGVKLHEKIKGDHEEFLGRQYWSLREDINVSLRRLRRFR